MKEGLIQFLARPHVKSQILAFSSDWPIQFNPIFIGYFILTCYCQAMQFTDQLHANEIHIM